MKKELIIAFVFCSLLLSAQNQLTVSEIWEDKFSPKRMESLRSMKDGNRYTVIDIDLINKESEIISRFYDSSENQEIILSSKKEVLVPFFTNYKFSKDEKKIIITTQEDKIYRRSTRGVFWVYNTTDKSLKMIYNKKIQEPHFSPDGEKVAFIFNRNLYIKNLIDDTIFQITKDGDSQTINGITDWVYEEEFGFVKAFEWNSDSSKIVFLRFDESKVPLFSMDIYGNDLYQYPYKFRYPKAGESNSKVSLHLFDLNNNNQFKVLFKDNFSPYYIPRFKFTNDPFVLSVQTINRKQNHLKLHSINFRTNTSKILIEEKSKTYVDVNSNLNFIEGKGFLWTSERNGYNHIYHYDSNGKLVNQLTDGKWEVTNLFKYNSKTKEIYFGAAKASSIERGVYSVGLNKKIRALTQETGYNGAAFSADGSKFIHAYSDDKTPPIYTLRSTKKGSKIRVILDNSDLKNKLQQYNLPNKEFTTLKINGYELNTYFIKPENFDPSKKYPLLLFQYSGPGSQQVTNRWGDNRDLWHKMLTQKGYVIACVDGRGTGFKGEYFKKMTYMKLGELETQDQISVAKKLSLLSYIDENRTGIWGWSYGGHMATHSLLLGNDVFEMAIAVAPVTNWRFYDTIYTERFMRTPQENPDGYDLNSPINYADRLKGKYLLIHGSGDDNVHVQNSMRMVQALIEANKQFEWMIYPDKNHGIYGGNTQNHLYLKMTNFILDNL
ncbi:MAG: S9 family peptidase [Flavobacteriaceae bacterium]|nr:S9 family peptidase [Flavobacteriaceae bacterium]